MHMHPKQFRIGSLVILKSKNKDGKNAFCWYENVNENDMVVSTFEVGTACLYLGIWEKHKDRTHMPTNWIWHTILIGQTKYIVSEEHLECYDE